MPPWDKYKTQEEGPWSKYGGAPAAPSGGGGMMMPVPQPPEPEQRSGIGDFFKSIPGGIVGGLAKTASAMGQAEAPLQGAPTPPGAEQSKQLAEQHLTGRLPEPQGTAGRVGATIGEALGSPSTYMGPSGLARNIVGGVGGALGAEAGGALTGGSTAGRLAGGMLGGLAGGTRGAAEGIPAPARTAIKEAAESSYDVIKHSPRKIPMEESSIVAESIRKKLNDEGVYREAPDGVSVFKTVDRLTQGLDASHITPAEIHGIAKTLQKISSSNPGNSTGRAAQIARQELFDYLQKFPELKQAIEIGNANYRVFKTSERLGEAAEKGQLGARGTMTGDNIDPALRTQMRQLYFNKKVSKTPEEKALLKSIVEGDTASNIAKKFALVKSPLRHMATAVMHAKGAGVLSHAAQMLAKHIANRNTMNQVEKLDALVRSTAPAAGGRKIPEASTRGTQRAIQAGKGALNIYEQ